MKNISVWFNRNGIDEEYFNGNFEKYDKESLKVICDKCDKLFSNNENIDVLFNEFEIENKGKGWVMYNYDGIGILVVDEGFDKKKCKKKYDELVEY